MTHVKFSRRPFESSINSLVDDLFTEMPALFKNGNSKQQEWKGFVPVNIKESEHGYTIEVVAPGFDKSDFKVNLEQNVLTISAEKREQNQAGNGQNEKIIRKEYACHTFKRSFTLDEKINAEAIDAKYVNGVLTLNLPRKEEVKTASKDINVL